jgi:hypothetical protein
MVITAVAAAAAAAVVTTVVVVVAVAVAAAAAAVFRIMEGMETIGDSKLICKVDVDFNVDEYLHVYGTTTTKQSTRKEEYGKRKSRSNHRIMMKIGQSDHHNNVFLFKNCMSWIVL